MKKSVSKKQKGLSDKELVKKYEAGKIDLKKRLKPALKKQNEMT